MNKNLLSLIAGLTFCSGFTYAQETKEVSFPVIADTWIREDATNDNYGGNATLETQRVEAKDGETVTGYSYYAGLIAFDYSVPAGMKVQKATLTLVTERHKGNDVIIRAYGNDFGEKDAKWNTEAQYVTEALSQDYLSTFTPRGQWDKSLLYDAISDDNKNLAAWVNNIDLTDYFKTLPSTTSRVNFLLTQEGDKRCNQNCFFTKENEGLDAAGKSGFAATPEELSPSLDIVFVEDATTITQVFTTTADTQIRKNNTTNYGNKPSMEIYYTEVDNNRDAEFYALMGFKGLPSELKSDDYKLESAILRLTSTRVKGGDRTMNIYEFGNEFAENTTFANEETYVRAALANDPITTFSMNGQYNKDLTDNGLSEEYLDAKKWMNYIDLTDYLSKKEDPTKFNIMITRGVANKEGFYLATKEAADILNSASGKTFEAKDLVPQLTITYSKKDDSTGIITIEAENDADAPVEYFNLQGIRVDNPTHGIYIRRQGTKTTKVVL